jgi:PAS domain S-box-containing protein
MSFLLNQTSGGRAGMNIEKRGKFGTHLATETTDALGTSARTFQILVESITDYAIFMLDPQGRVANWNSGAEKIKGYTRAEIIGEHFSRFYTEEDRLAGVPDRALATASSEGRFEQESWRVRKDGTRFWANVIIDAIWDEHGRLIGFAKVTRDMTERRLLEEKLRQSQKMDALGQLTGGIAHDFNNLLTVILGSLEMLSRWMAAPEPAPLTVRLTRAMAAAKDSARRASTLTRRLLAFSRQQPLQPKIIDLNRLVYGLVDMLRRTLGEQITIKTILSFDTGLAYADPSELENALLNLAVNARDAMPNGGELTIETTNINNHRMPGEPSHSPNGRYILIAVKDTGIGMDQQTLASAFDPFFTTKGIGRGTGLGLSQVYGFVEQSGGHVLIDSQLGVGTVVQIFLPRLQENVGKPELQLKTVEPEEQSGSELILVVEDDDAIRGYITDVLRELGYDALDAPNAGAALEILDRQPNVQLLVTDIGLPGAMNGRELSDEARQRRPSLKVLFTTGYTRDTIVRAGRLDRGIALLTKPFTLSDLTTKVREVLDE